MEGGMAVENEGHGQGWGQDTVYTKDPWCVNVTLAKHSYRLTSCELGNCLFGKEIWCSLKNMVQVQSQLWSSLLSLEQWFPNFFAWDPKEKFAWNLN